MKKMDIFEYVERPLIDYKMNYTFFSCLIYNLIIHVLLEVFGFKWLCHPKKNRLCETIVNIIEIKKVLSILSDYHRATANFIRLPFFPLEHSILVEIMCFF